MYMFINVVHGNTCNPGEGREGVLTSGTCSAPITTEDECKAAVAAAGGSYYGQTSTTSILTCVNCSLGKFSTAIGADSNTTCNDCAPGKFNPDQGSSTSSSCKICPGAKVSLDFGLPTCEECKSGAPNTKKSGCIECIPGQFHNKKNNLCQKCDSGHACPAKAIQQTQCLAGTYALAQKSECSNCDLGQYTDKPGQKECLPCPKGRYQDGRGKSNCMPCPVDTYGDQTGYTAAEKCTRCKTDTSTLGKVGQISSSSCYCKDDTYPSYDETKLIEK